MLQQAQDVVDTVHAGPLPSPLPGGLAAISRFLFNVPTWFQISGAIVGAAVAAWVCWYLWKRRAAILTWITTRSRGAKIGLASAALVMLAGFAVVGAYGWHFMMHDNSFCSSCHVMSSAFSRFQHSEHKKLECHDCHQQSMYANVRQMVLWVLEKPQVIPMHKQVANEVCARCHIQDVEKGDSVWKRITATAGHRLHLHSDSASLKNVKCVTCHGLEVHHFAPVDSTCGQSNCHQSVRIHLGKMANQTQLHCVRCHQFTGRVSETISLDSSRRTLVPNMDECFDCHEMKKRMGNYEPAKDPHQAVCGACHDPHKDKTPADAWARCGNSGCHVRPDTIPFHRALSTATLDKCGSCHKAHSWTLAADQCLACHQNVLEDRPSPRRTSAGGTPVTFAKLGLPLAGVSLKFSHRRHRNEECTACHATGKQHGKLLLTGVKDCQGCHHATPTKTASGTPSKTCATCHASADLAYAIPDTVSVRLSVWQAARTRVLGFRHANHTTLECGRCHTTAVTLARPADVTCASCHDQHHDPTAQCRTCHLPSKNAHTRQAHLGCTESGCHSAQAVAQLQPKRNVCLVCHQTKVDHQPGKECAACHQVQWLSQQKGAP